MSNTLNLRDVCSGIFALILLAIGVLNVILVHPVPGISYILLSLIYTPTVNTHFQKKFGFPIPLVAKIFLGIATMMFTLGVSDLGDMIDKL